MWPINIFAGCCPFFSLRGQKPTRIKDIFEYQPLRLTELDLRLLIIKPGAWEDDVDAEIQHATMEEDVKYKAISYCWGDAKRIVPIQISGQTMWITQNAWGALRNFRSRKEKVCVWLDAICID
jgi:hypothetical protein